MVASLLSACPRPSPRPSGCGKDADCKGARICSRNGVCVEPPSGSAARIDADADAPPEPDAASRPGSPPFAMFGGDAQNTGRLAGPAPENKPVELWSVTTGGPIVGSPTVGPDGTVFVGSHDGKLYAVAPDGAVRWTFTTGDRVWSTPAVADSGTVYIGSDDDHLYAIHGGTGELVWRFRVGSCEPPMGPGPVGSRCDVDGGPTIGPDGTIYTGGDGVYAIWPEGTLRWKFATAEHVMTAPALAPPGSPQAGTVYAGCLDDAVYAILPDGTKAWEVRTKHDIESSPAVAPDGTIYVGGDDDRLYAIAPDGRVLWKVVTGGDVRSSPAIAPDGTIYVGSHDGGLYAISPEGEVKWRFAAADKIQGSPVVATNGVVLFGAQDDHLYAVSPTGALLWYIAFDGDVDASPTVSRDGVVYAASDDKTLRAFR
jgi:outer membrane protein assembly factor BamB